MSPSHRPRLAGLSVLLCAALAAAPGPVDLSLASPALSAPPRPAVDDVPAGWPVPPAATASAYLVVDATTGQVLAERNADELRPVASTIKVLTALTVLNRTEPTDVVTVPSQAAAVGGASVGLRAGDRWTIAQLLDALIARSGNDAATALAIHVGGSVPGFIDLMRADAAALGLGEVRLSTPSGLDDANRLSARDLATIARAALTDPAFREVSARPVVTLPRVGAVASRNELLGRYPGATGIKTGFTEAAGYSLVASAERDGREVVVVVLGSASSDGRFTDAASLLDHAFTTFTPTEVSHRTTLAVAGGRVDVTGGPVELLVPREDPVVTVTIDLPVEAPSDSSEREVDVTWGGDALGTMTLTTSAPARPDVTGGGVIGRALVDRAYAAMRAATSRSAWPG